MYYQGGKKRIGKKIANVMLTRDAPRRVIDPFIGGGGFLLRLLESGYDGEIIAGDFDPDITILFKALGMGWLPPKQIPSKEEWERVMMAEDFGDTALRAFTFFPSYLRGIAAKPRYNPVAFVRRGKTGWEEQWLQAARLSEAILNTDASITFIGGDYRGYEEFLTTRTAVYCDPPYAHTLGYYKTGEFDNETFWEVAREWSSRPGVSVYVSEYNAPEEWESVMTNTVARPLINDHIKNNPSLKGSQAMEQLYTLVS